jgi:hypothetical protein
MIDSGVLAMLGSGVSAGGQIGGSFGSGDAVVESVAVIPTPNGGSDQLWMIVRRTVNGMGARHVEFMEETFAEDEDIEDAFFVDSGLTYDGALTTSIMGLNHLEGETVEILADGQVQEPKIVTDGSVTLDTAAYTVHVGLAYNSDLETLRLDSQSGGGLRASKGTQGITKRINSIVARFHRTNTGTYGRSESQLDPIQFRDLGDDMDAPVPLFTGDKKLPIELGNDREAKLFFRQDKPLPFNILSMTVIGESGTR